ncbi:MAG: 6-carboxytetrahydropterin synthase [Elusimicrobiaceae bacterium]|nr:6-carboxytetrahydropterin synthase [Elusimicrobiaceae bacterium]
MSKVYLTQAGSFHAKHSHDGTLAEPLHDHLFRYEATFYGDINEEHFLIDFRQISHLFKTELEKGLDGSDLTTFLPFPTAESLAIWIYDRVKARMPQLYSIKVAEDVDRWVEYRGEE